MKTIKSLNALIPHNIPIEENETWSFSNELISSLEQSIPQLQSNAFLDLCNYGKKLVCPTWFMLLKEEKLLNTLLKREDIEFILNEYAYLQDNKGSFSSKVYCKYPRESKTNEVLEINNTMTYGKDLVTFPVLYNYNAKILKKLMNAGLIVKPQFPTVFLRPKYFLSILEENIFLDENNLLNNIIQLKPQEPKNIFEIFYWYNKSWKDMNNSVDEGYYIAQCLLLAEKNDYDTNLRIYEYISASKKEIVEQGYYREVLEKYDPELYNILQNIILEEKLEKDLPIKKNIKSKKL